MLVSLLTVAIAMGIGIGILVASLRTPSRVAFNDPVEAGLKRRLSKLTTEMRARNERGERVPEHAWELVGTAGVAISDRKSKEADSRIKEIERLLARTSSTASVH